MAREMRVILAEKLEELMRANKKIVVVDADLASANGTWALRSSFPGRALDVGVAEQNMASFAAGLASYGFIPFISSFSAFVTRRCFDQLAVSICYAGLNVKIIGTDPGISAELNGGTHMCFEDIALMRSLPGMVVFEPADGAQLAQGLEQAAAYDGPVYIRFHRKQTESIVPGHCPFDLFTADLLTKGDDVSLLAGGLLVPEALRAATLLQRDGISAEVINVHTLKPLDEQTLLASVQKTGCVVTAENHRTVGGLRSAVAELLADTCPVPVKAIGVGDHFGEVGRMDYLKKKYRLTAEDIAEAAKGAIAAKRSHF